MVSKDVSRWLVKRLGSLCLGHVGTLDPLAEGVLPVLFGQATRLQDHLLVLPKIYEFECRFGEETETLDIEGPIVLRLPWEHLTSEGVRLAVESFIGPSLQVPPLYSAVKVKGRALYDYARSGDEVGVALETLKRSIVIDLFEMLSFSGQTATFRIRCSKGTYIRAIVRDLAVKLGTCATMTRLVRTESAGLTLADALTLETIEEKIADFQSILLPIEEISIGLPRWISRQPELSDRLKFGQTLRLAAPAFYDQIHGNPVIRPGEALFKDGQSLLLVDQIGKVFGLGSVEFEQLDEIKLSMRRGLL
jgi:tRNA pseudouridine55 synthase